MEAFLRFMTSPWGIVIFTVVALAVIIFFLAVNYRFFTKAVLDFIFGLIALILISPCIAVCAVILKKKAGKVFEEQYIIGKNGKFIPVRVFASYTAADGRECYISRSALRYIPLVLEVVCGKLSLIGPAPLSLTDGSLIDDEYEMRFTVRPGIFSAAVLSFPRRPQYEDMFTSDCDYAAKRSLFTDFKAFIVNVLRIMRGEEQGYLTVGRSGYADELLSDGAITQEQYEEAKKLAEEELEASRRAKFRVG